MRRLNKIILLALVLGILFSSVSVASAGFYDDMKIQISLTIVTQMVRASNQAIEALIRAAQLTPYDDVAYLLAATNLISTNTIAHASTLNILVVCEYKPYFVDGRTVYIDPLRVIGPKT